DPRSAHRDTARLVLVLARLRRRGKRVAGGRTRHGGGPLDRPARDVALAVRRLARPTRRTGARHRALRRGSGSVPASRGRGRYGSRTEQLGIGRSESWGRRALAAVVGGIARDPPKAWRRRGPGDRSVQPRVPR